MTAAELLDKALTLLGDGQPDAERLRGLAEWFSTGAREVDGIDEAAREARRSPQSVLLAGGAGSPALGLRWFPPGVPTAVHGHGSWGVATVIEGRDRYERWEHHRVAEVTELGRGDAVWWREPPHDVHRQEGLGCGATELVLAGRYTPRGKLTAAERVALLVQSGDVAGLTALYRGDSLLDVNVPTWRYELQGPEAIRRALEEDMPPTRRLTGWRATMTEDGLVAEVEARVTDTASGEEEMSREIHVLHLAGESIAEHTIYCTGVWDRATMARHEAEALIRR
ncbi:MAG: hypothetical protein M3N32_12035 [Actinomycetota bacterium]|nr:hypothetical protein [Actinomycetota bacterium]